ncbi:MAG: YezD family protein [Vicinamibacteria bacterium]
MTENTTNTNPTKDAPETAWERTVRHAVRGLRYGSVEVQVHDGRVVQVETREKVRFAEDRRPDGRKQSGEND